MYSIEFCAKRYYATTVMIDYSIYDFDEKLKKELMGLKVDYAFQPILDRDDNVFAYEALMRPADCKVTELIDEYNAKEKLHVLEVATLFGVFQEYESRGIKEKVCINSFPSEYLSNEEVELFLKSFPNSKKNGIVEMLEYPSKGFGARFNKLIHLLSRQVFIAIDDFSTGSNDITSIDKYRPDIVKLDRSLISEIDSDSEKQTTCINWVNQFHDKEIYVLAEGVETKGEYDFLRSIRVDLFQGYYLGYPA